jgi:hypothetical protein
VPTRDYTELTRFEAHELAGEFPVSQDDGRFTFDVGRLRAHPEWVVRAEFEIRGGDLLLRGLAIRPAGVRTPDSGLTTEVLRSVRIGWVKEAGQGKTDLPEPYGPWFGVHPNEFHRVRRPGRRGRDDSFYARWSAEYLDFVHAGSKPLKRLAKKRNVSESQARSLLYEARRRDLLTGSPSGRAGGHLTEKAKRILRTDDGDGQ